MANPGPLIEKAAPAARSAALLLGNGDIDGACKCAHAIFDVARATLLATGTDQESIRTHSGLVTAFGLRLVKSDSIERSLGHVLDRAHEIRLIADYTGDLVDIGLAAWMVEQSAQFVEATRGLVESQT